MEGGPVAADLSSGAVRTIPVTARLPSLRESNVTHILVRHSPRWAGVRESTKHRGQRVIMHCERSRSEAEELQTRVGVQLYIRRVPTGDKQVQSYPSRPWPISSPASNIHIFSLSLNITGIPGENKHGTAGTSTGMPPRAARFEQTPPASPRRVLAPADCDIQSRA